MQTNSRVVLYDPEARPVRRLLGIRLRHFNGWSILWCHLAQASLIIFGTFGQQGGNLGFTEMYMPLMALGLFAAFFINLHNRQRRGRRKLAVFAYRSAVCAVLLFLNPLTLIPLSLMTTSVTSEEIFTQMAKYGS